MADFNKTLIFTIDFQKRTRISSFIQIRPVGAEFLHTDGRTDGQTNGHDEANSRFSQLFERA